MRYFKQFECCIIVRGANRSLLCDLQRQSSHFIPNDLAIVTEELNNKKSLEEIFTEYGSENRKIIEEYIEFLIENEFGFYCNEDEFDRFPKLDTEYKVPFSITNSIIELTKDKIENLTVVSDLDKLGCKDISLIFYEELKEQDFKKILSFFDDSRIKSVEITCKYHSEVNDKFLKIINNFLSRLTRVSFYGAPFNRLDHWDNSFFFDRIYCIEEINSFKSCGIVEMKYFNVNMPKYLESVNHNSCLNQKISIDINGDIRNCPSMPQSFGNIKKTSLIKALNHKDFKKYWNITKDEIEVCKDCEFRHVCTDCRAYKADIKSDYSKPLKCGYNPYTNVWEEWSTNSLKQKAIEHYGLQEVIKKNDQ